jgi:hypothetical protein
MRNFVLLIILIGMCADIMIIFIIFIFLKRYAGYVENENNIKIKKNRKKMKIEKEKGINKVFRIKRRGR